ncbi:hypothetical protein F2Q68_00043724 [Brassica cretica]|uniref:Uncharacterized protein n=1 Tax=Brassica cretica TaxID=69181 RepID=A0A8S9LKE5_BRACR|nr:hypothetical protein F2Q68_00043724 [Brassica cretica]
MDHVRSREVNWGRTGGKEAGLGPYTQPHHSVIYVVSLASLTNRDELLLINAKEMSGVIGTYHSIQTQNNRLSYYPWSELKY